MKTYLLLGLSALVLIFGVSSAASATIKFRFDNPPSANSNDVIQINPDNLGVPFTASMSPCTDFGGLPDDMADMVSCFGFNNVSGKPLTAITFSFTVPGGSPLIGQTMECESGNYLASTGCPGGTAQADTLYTLMYGGGSAIPDNHDFYFGVDKSGMPPFTIDANPLPTPVPEPANAGLLFTLGLLGLALAYGWRRREWKKGARIG